MSNGLIITRDIALRAIRDKDPTVPIFGIGALILLNFRDIRWVDYLPPMWSLDFYDHREMVLWKLTYF